MAHSPKRVPLVKIRRDIAQLEKLRKRARDLVNRYDAKEQEILDDLLEYGVSEIDLADGRVAVFVDNFLYDNIIYRTARVKRLQLMFRKTSRSRVLHSPDFD